MEGTYIKPTDVAARESWTHICESCRVYRKWGKGQQIEIKLLGRGYNLRALIHQLSSKEARVRQYARISMVSNIKSAMPYLIEALQNPDRQVRWEAAKTLSALRDSAAVDALVKSLEDTVFDIRWLAAKGLINLRSKALVPLLQALIERPDSTWLRQGAHHVLHEVDTGGHREIIEPVLEALEGADAVLHTPLAARSALDELKGKTVQKVYSKI
jgi:HEAT repeat protein